MSYAVVSESSELDHWNVETAIPTPQHGVSNGIVSSFICM